MKNFSLLVLDKACLGLLTVALEGREDDNVDGKAIDIRRARLSMRVLINAANRSEKFDLLVLYT